MTEHESEFRGSSEFRRSGEFRRSSEFRRSEETHAGADPVHSRQAHDRDLTNDSDFPADDARTMRSHAGEALTDSRGWPGYFFLAAARPTGDLAAFQLIFLTWVGLTARRRRPLIPGTRT